MSERPETPKPSGKIPVFLRLKPKGNRPLSDRKLVADPPGSSRVVMGDRVYKFDGIFGETISQIDLYKSTVFPLVKNVIQGHDSLFFAMGASGSGKSYTTLGNKPIPGMIHLTVNTIFESLKDHIAKYEVIENIRGVSPDRTSTAKELGMFLDWTRDNIQKQAFQDSSMYHEKVPINRKGDYGVYISMAEIYNDKVYDLFEETPSGRRRNVLSINTDPITRKTYFGGINKLYVSNAQEAYKLLEKGQKSRISHSTGSNDTSSRSHAFTTFEIKYKDSNNELTASQMTIVDLAGTERNKIAKTAGDRFQESCAINQSLMLLGKCLQMQQTKRDQKDVMMNEFRSCKLTHILLSNAFLFNSTQKSVMMVTVDPFGDANSITQIFRYSAAAQDIPDAPATPSRALPSLTPLRASTVPSYARPVSRMQAERTRQDHSSSPQKGRVRSDTPNIFQGRFGGSETPRTPKHGHEFTASASQRRQLPPVQDFKTGSMSSDHTIPTIPETTKSVNESAELQRYKDLVISLELKLKRAEKRCLEIEEEVRIEMSEEVERQFEELKENYLDFRDEEHSISQEHVDKKVKLAVDAIRDEERDENYRTIATLKNTVQSLSRENTVLKEHNERLKTSLSRPGSQPGSPMSKLTKSNRIGKSNPLSYIDSDNSD